MQAKGFLPSLKLSAGEKNNVHYELSLEDKIFSLNDYLGKKFKLEFLGEIRCIFCSAKIRKSHSSGSCYQCFISLPQNDLCIMKPETCHFHMGNCRNSVWGEENCFQKHAIYLSNTSGLKIGITRFFRLEKRWLEQGASLGIQLASVRNRKQAGEIEIFLKSFVSDRTNWRKMLSETPSAEGFSEAAETLKQKIKENFNFAELEKKPSLEFKYPILKYPAKINSYNLEKKPVIEDTLIGLKGQYLLFENGVINLKKLAGFNISIEIYS